MKKLSNRSLILGGAIGLHLSRPQDNWFIGVSGARQLAATLPTKKLHLMSLKDYKKWLTQLNKKYYWDLGDLDESAQQLRKAYEEALKRLI